MRYGWKRIWALSGFTSKVWSKTSLDRLIKKLMPDYQLAESRVAVVAGITYSNVTSRNISWYHFSWATLYICWGSRKLLPVKEFQIDCISTLDVCTFHITMHVLQHCNFITGPPMNGIVLFCKLSSVGVCRRLWRAWAVGRCRARGRSGGLHCKAGQYGYVQLGDTLFH